MNFREEPFIFDCQGDRLIGITAHPQSPADIGVLIIVGGPQYRVGSHRQFVLLARDLSASGIPTMRFDFRGSGDATGEQRTYENIDADIGVAVNALLSRMPDVKRVVLWGLCGAASAALFYAYRDPRIAGLVLVNPWVRTEEGIANVYLRHYYVRRLFEGQFWRRVLSGDFDASASIRSLADVIRSAARGRKRRRADAEMVIEANTTDPALPLPTRMAIGLERFGKDVLIILSPSDYTAREFREAIDGNAQWDAALARNRVTSHSVEGANHTFASKAWRDEVASVTLQWLQKLVLNQAPLIPSSESSGLTREPPVLVNLGRG